MIRRRRTTSRRRRRRTTTRRRRRRRWRRRGVMMPSLIQRAGQSKKGIERVPPVSNGKLVMVPEMVEQKQKWCGICWDSKW